MFLVIELASDAGIDALLEVIFLSKNEARKGKKSREGDPFFHQKKVG